MEILAPLLLVFKDPVNVILLMLVGALAYVVWFHVLKPMPGRIEADLKLAASLDGLRDIIERHFGDD